AVFLTPRIIAEFHQNSSVFRKWLPVFFDFFLCIAHHHERNGRIFFELRTCIEDHKALPEKFKIGYTWGINGNFSAKDFNIELRGLVAGKIKPKARKYVVFH